MVAIPPMACKATLGRKMGTLPFSSSVTPETWDASQKGSVPISSLAACLLPFLAGMLDFILYIAVALGLGLIVGLQRETSASEIAGIRTFPLIALFGVFAGHFAMVFHGVVLAGALLATMGLLWMGNYTRWQNGELDPGLTTEFAALVMFCVGAALPGGYMAGAVVTTGAVSLLLYYKASLHSLAGNLDEDEFRALASLVLIGLVILPALPNETYGPYEVLNPFNIWLMVVLIVGISMGAYIVYRLLGARAGTILGGILGGLISSTAATVSYARRCKENDGLLPQAVLVIYIASAVVFVRVLGEILLVAPTHFRVLAPPMIATLLFMTVFIAVHFYLSRSNLDDAPQQRPPKDLKAAVVFGLLYALVLLAVAAAREHLDERALYIVAAISGLTDMDAITLSTAQLVKQGQIEADIAWRLILVGGLSNLVFKAIAALVLGGIRLFLHILPLFVATLVAGTAMILFAP